MHRPALELETVDLVAVSDIDAERGRQRAAELGCPFYTDYRVMLTETRPEVAVIMTPHPSHASIALDCLQAGCHVLVEKPMAVHVAEADAMIAAAKQANRLLAVVFQHRHHPAVRMAHRLIQQGALGDIQHVDLIATWLRTAVYYRLAPWRGTWIGEGGGVLLNQAAHHLDLLCHLVGMPGRVLAWTRTRLHQIETEDTVQAMLEWENGAMGSVHVSTAEAGQPGRLEIRGTGGYLQLTAEQVRLSRLEIDLRDHIAQSPHPFCSPSLQPVPVELEPGTGDHVAVYRNLHQAILQGTPVSADGTEGRRSLELANAMIYSSHTQTAVEFPLDRQRYVALLDELKTGHTNRNTG
ncbi:MAG: gfo/Idh/MocA family oxidoreductase [Nitrospinota bacterium]|nr:MAG: gfo/Idh/MocA family oxidoreductase [Nitrospinota bacterium]